MIRWTVLLWCCYESLLGPLMGNTFMCNIKKQLETENNRYQDKLVQSTIRQLIASIVSEEAQTQQQVLDKNEDPITIVLPFKDQKSTDAVRRQLADLSRNINATISSVYTSAKDQRRNQSEGRQTTPFESTIKRITTKGSLGNNDGDGNGNENGKKRNMFILVKQQLCTCITCITLFCTFHIF